MRRTTWKMFLIPAIVAAVAAGVLAAPFKTYMPIAEFWVKFESILFPLSALNLVFHEAGHWIFGMLGFDFLRVLGGTLMQVAFPIACGVYFAAQKNRAGVGLMLFWLGMNFVNISFYVADARMQSIILITGMSGQEGGGHDWAYLLGNLGLVPQCVGIGQTIFFLGCALMIFPVVWLLTLYLRSLTASSPR